tara:strand:+ start:1597 stop:2310 length:714 start_codon:yes stop_codon:yes gene_type:complete
MINISILTPIYNRNKCKDLIINNINNFNYDKTKLEYIILDDGKDKFIKNNIELNNFKKQIHPVKFKYIYHNIQETIGKKRNKLVKLASHNVVAFMDSDDFYLPTYLINSIEKMKEGYNIVGSNQMIFCYTTENIKDKWIYTAIQCDKKSLIHEATMVFNKKHFNAMGGFATRENRSEGIKMIEGMADKNVGLTDIDKCMICLCHPNNTISKDIFKDKETINFNFNEEYKYLIIKSLY